jgi:hypothetical protein
MSLVQNTAVGPGPRVHGGHGDLGENGGGIQPGPLYRPEGAAAPVGALTDRDRPVDQGDTAVPEPEQVTDRDLASPPVVDGDRGLPRRTRPVEQHHGRTPLADPAQLGRPAVDRGDEDAAHPLLLEHAQVPALLVVRLVGVAQDHGVPRGLGVVLGAARDLSEERVGRVEHDQPETAAVAGPKLAGGSVRDEAELLHRGLDADKTVLLGPPFVFTSDNINQFDF